MSTTIDEKVVSMRFDNQNFEKNVQTSMSTLDKLKAKFNFKGTSKGLEEVQQAAKKVNLEPIGNSAEKVGLKFDALYTMADQVFRNIANSAMAYGKKIVSAFTIDPIKSGFSEYETQINAVQTILANTEKENAGLNQAEKIEKVNGYLDKLNQYADKTIYNFTEMTRNIGTFTAAGVDLDTSVTAIQGIANLAAVSGSTSQQASTAMYQLSQALSSGTVKLMDWNSVVNAGMGGQVFQDALKETARAHGIAIDSMIESEGSFRETLSNGWLTSDVLTETLSKFTMATEGLTDAQIEQNRQMLKAKGYTDEQIEGIFALGNTATNAATKVKTFTQLMDTLKEAAQSGWTQTWEIIVGDFEEAKEMFTKVSDFIGGIIGKFNDARNWLLEKALNFAAPWKAVMDKLDAAGITKIAKAVSDVTDKLKYFQDIVTDVWIGHWKTSDTGRYDLLDAAGYDHRVVQDLVNLGYGYQITMEDIEASHKKFGLTMETTTESTEEVVNAINNLTVEQMKNAGLTEQEIEMYKELAEESKRTGVSIEDLAKKMSETSGRTLLMESLGNVGKSLVAVFKSIGQAWLEIFPPPSFISIYNALESIRNFTKHMIMSEERADQVKRTLKGLFAALDIVLTIVGGPLKIAIKLVGKILEVFGTNIWSVTAHVGDAIVKFRDWIDAILDFSWIMDDVVTPIKNALVVFKDWLKSLKDMADSPEAIADSIINGFKYIFNGIKNLLTKFGNYIIGGFESVPGDAIAGFVNGIWKGIKVAGQVILELGKRIVTTITDYLGIHSPSLVFMAIGGFIVAGLASGIFDNIPVIGDAMKAIGEKITSIAGPIVDKTKELFSNIDFSKITTVLAGSGIFTILYKLTTAFNAIVAPMQGVGDTLEGVGEVLQKSAIPIAETIHQTSKVLKGFSKTLKAMAFSIRMQALKDLAIAIAIIVATVVVLSFIDPAKLWNAVAVVAALAAILLGLSIAIEKLSSVSIDLSQNAKGLKIDGLKQSLIGIAFALLLVAAAIRLIGGMETNQIIAGFISLIIIVGLLSAVMYAICKLVNGRIIKSIQNVGSMMIKLSIALLLLVYVIKVTSKLEPERFAKGLVCITLLGVLIAGLMAATRLAGNSIDKLGGTLIKISISMLLLTLVVQMISNLDPSECALGLLCITQFALIVAGLIGLLRLGSDKTIAKVGTTILAVSFAMLLMAGTIMILSILSVEAILKGIACMVVFGGLIKGMIKLLTIGNDKQVAKVGLTIFAISISLAIMAAISLLLGMIDIASLTKGVIAMSVLAAMMAVMIHATKGAHNIHKTVMQMSIAIGVMALSVAVLSFIDPAKLAGATLALSMLMGMFALMTLAVSKLKKIDITSILMLVIVAGLLAALVVVISNVDNPDGAVKVAAGLALTIAGISAALMVASVIGKLPVKDIVTGILALTAMVVPLMAFVAVIHFMPDISKQEKNVSMLIGFMVSMTTLMAVLTGLGIFIAATGGAIAIAGIGSLTAMIIPLIAFVTIIHFMPDISKSEKNIQLLMDVMDSMVGLLERLAVVCIGAVIGVKAITLLTTVMAKIAALAAVMGAIISIPGLESFVDKGINLLIKLANGIGQMIGAFVGGIAQGFMSVLPAIGASLSGFSKNAEHFLNTVSDSDKMEAVAKGTAALIGAVLLVAAGTFISAITTLLTLGTGFWGLGMELSSFALGAKGFIDTMAGIKPEVLDGVKVLAEAILAITAGSFLNRITSFLDFKSGTPMSRFGNDIAMFGESFKKFSDSLDGISVDTAERAKLIAETMKHLAKAADNVPSSGGAFDWLFGDDSLSTFAEGLPGIAADITELGNVLRDNKFDEDLGKLVEAAADAIGALASIEINGTGGSWDKFFGDESLGTFCEQLPEVGLAVAKMLWHFKKNGLTDKEIGYAKIAAEVITALADLELPNTGGISSFWSEEESLGSFCEQLPKVGESMALFTAKIGTISHTNRSNIETFTALFRSLANMFEDGSALDLGDVAGQLKDRLLPYLIGFIDGLNDIKSDDIDRAIVYLRKLFSGVEDSFDKVKNIDIDTITTAIEEIAKVYVAITGIANSSEGMKNAGTYLSDFCTSVAAIDATAVQTATDRLTEITTLLKSITSTDADSAKNFNDALESFGKNGITEFANAIKSTNSKTKITEAFDALVVGAADGATSVKNYDEFYAIGTYLVEGFRDGIQNNFSIVETALNSISNSTIVKMKQLLGIKSPSKEFAKLGYWTVSGLAKGLDDNADMAGDSSENLGVTLLETIKDFLGIHSPSLVFKKDVGRWIVEGVAEGIDENTSAEEAIEKKASNIVSAFQKKLEELSTVTEKNDLEYELWEAQNSGLGEAAKSAKQIETLTKNLTTATEKTKIAHDEYLNTVEILGENSEAAKEAWNKYLQASIDEQNTINEIAEVKKNSIESLEEISRSNEDIDYELWVAKHPDVPLSIKHARELQYLDDRRYDLSRDEVQAWTKYNNLLKDPEYGPEHADTLKAYGEWRSVQREYTDIENRIIGIQKESVEDRINSAKELRDANKEAADVEYDNWIATHPNATEEEKDLAEIKRLTAHKYEISKETEVLRRKYNETLRDENASEAEKLSALNDYKASLTEEKNIDNQITELLEEGEERKKEEARRVYEANKEAADIKYERTINRDNITDEEKDAALIRKYTEQKYEDERIYNLMLKDYRALLKNEKATAADIAEAKNALDEQWDLVCSYDRNIAQVQKDALERAADNLEKQRELLSDIAQLRYDIWEEIYGEDATDEEKDAKKLEMLNEQAIIQAQMVGTAQEEYNKVLKEAGGDASSNKVLEAQQKLLTAQLELARLKGQILDIEEEAADRQKRLQDKQRIAQSDYNEYLKKYKKYYLENGMTLEDLERDARLVSGYDPSAVINEAIKNNSPKETFSNILTETSKAIENVESDPTYKGMVENLGEMGSSYVTAISEGMSANVSIVTNAVTSIVNKCITTLETRYSSWKDSGIYLVKGFIRGIKSYTNKAAREAALMAAAALEAANDVLSINSPSKEFEKIGMYVDLGLARGLRGYSYLSENEASTLGDSIVNQFTNTIARIADAIDSDIDTQPTIRPVLDLSNVESGTARLDAMFSRTQAMTAGADIARNTAPQDQNGNVSDNGTTNTWNFTQNNYSPKALSPAEIYRQTRNQFSALKGALNK